MASNDEHHIIFSIRKGDKKSFEDLFKRYFVPLVNFAQKYVVDLNDARDIVQVTFIKIWEIRETLPSNLNIRPYLYKSL
jgi:RNA polymerase sigma-70 factor (ECF subfamily)